MVTIQMIFEGSCVIYKNHEFVKKLAELTIVTMHFVWPSLDQAEQCCTYSGCVRMYSLQLCVSGRNVPGVVLRHVPGVVRFIFNSQFNRSAGLPVSRSVSQSLL